MASSSDPAVKPVIRQVELNADDTATRVLNRYLPAWVISGAMHVVVIGCLTIFLSGPAQMDGKTNDSLVTAVEAPEDQPNLVEEELGFNPDLKPATNADKEDNANVIAPKSDEAMGLDNQPDDPSRLAALAGLNPDLRDSGLSQTHR